MNIIIHIHTDIERNTNTHTQHTQIKYIKATSLKTNKQLQDFRTRVFVPLTTSYPEGAHSQNIQNNYESTYLICPP